MFSLDVTSTYNRGKVVIQSRVIASLFVSGDQKIKDRVYNSSHARNICKQYILGCIDSNRRNVISWSVSEAQSLSGKFQTERNSFISANGVR